MKQGEQPKIITGFYDEYQKKKAKKQASSKNSTEEKPKPKGIVKIHQPITVRTYGRIRQFFSRFLSILKYLAISLVASLILTVLLNGEIRTQIIELIKNLISGG